MPRLQVSGYFSFRTQKCPRPHARIRVEIEFARPHVSDTYLDSIFHPGLPGNIGNGKCVIKPANFVSCSTFHDKELGSILLHHRIKKNIYIYIYIYLHLASTRFWIHSVFKNFHSGRGFKKLRIRMPYSPLVDKCGRKPYVERKSCASQQGK